MFTLPVIITVTITVTITMVIILICLFLLFTNMSGLLLELTQSIGSCCGEEVSLCGICTGKSYLNSEWIILM